MQQEPTAIHPSFGRRIFLRAAGAAFGVVVASAGIGGLLYWWQSRPQSWDTAAITATFDSVDTEGEKQTLLFFYVLENHTDHDYRIERSANVTVAARLKEQGTLSPDMEGEFLTAEFPLFVPAREKVLYRLHLGYPYRLEEPLPPDSERKAGRTAVAAYAAAQFKGNVPSSVEFG